MKRFRIHAFAYGVGALAFLLVALMSGDVSWFFWPAMVWGAVVAFHYMYAKSLVIDNSWADRRAADVVEKAYDLGHIEDIHKRHDDPPSPGPGKGTVADRPTSPPGSSKTEGG